MKKLLATFVVIATMAFMSKAQTTKSNEKFVGNFEMKKGSAEIEVTEMPTLILLEGGRIDMPLEERKQKTSCKIPLEGTKKE